MRVKDLVTIPGVTRRRVLLAGAGALLAPAGVGARPRATPRVGFICARPGPSSHTESFERGLRDLGYVVGRDVVIEYRFMPAESRDPFPGMATDLVRRSVDVIVVGSPLAIRAAQDATRIIPLVMAQSDDPVRSGFVASLRRPGGNLTGLSSMAPEIGAKQLELLKAVVPRMPAAAVLWNRAGHAGDTQMRALENAARALEIRLQSYPARGAPGELREAVAAMKRTRVGGLIVLPDMMFFDHLTALVELPASAALPAIYGEREFVDAGGLMSYGTSYDDLFYRAATYVDRLLKKARAADLPIEQPTRFELVVNAGTARALKLTIPGSVLLQAEVVGS